MELRQLRYFVKIAELNSFSEAARNLNITQSTLSQQIKQLEGELDVELLVRDTHHVHLTDIGEAFLPAAQRTLNEAKNSIDKINDVKGLNTGELNIGSTFTFSPLLNEVLLLFMKAYPGVKINVFCKSMEELMLMLEHQKIDIALSYKPSQNYQNIESHHLFDNQLCVVMSDTHPLANEKSLRWADLEKCQLALPSKGLQARNAFDRVMSGLDYKFDVRIEINEIAVLLNLVRKSRLVTLLSQATVSRGEGLVSIPLSQKGCEMEGSFHIARNTFVKRTTKEFIRLLCENRSFGMAMMEIL